MFATWTFYVEGHSTETQRNHIFPQMPVRTLECSDNGIRQTETYDNFVGNNTEGSYT
jgi:hypothetical protein